MMAFDLYACSIFAHIRLGCFFFLRFGFFLFHFGEVSHFHTFVRVLI